jgi:hypothetical protein
MTISGEVIRTRPSPLGRIDAFLPTVLLGYTRLPGYESN